MMSTAGEGKGIARTPSPGAAGEQNSADNGTISGTGLDTPSVNGDLDDYDEEPDDPDPQDATSSSYRANTNKILFLPLTNLVGSHMKENTPSPLAPATSRAEHNKAYRTIWRDLMAKAAAEDSIPNSLFDQPRSFIEVKVAQWPRPEEDHYCCPCDLDDYWLSGVEIRVPKVEGGQGITKEEFLKVLGRAFYGQEDGDREEETADGNGDGEPKVTYTVGDENDRPVIDYLDYMIGSDGLMGHLYAMTRGYKE